MARVCGKAHPPQDCLEKVINPLDLSGATPFDQKTRSEVPPDEGADERVQKTFRQSCWNYIGKFFIEPSQQEAEEDAKPCLKKFWTYIKHQRTANTGTAPLKALSRLVTDPKQKAGELKA